jgi:hypothetical protein
MANVSHKDLTGADLHVPKEHNNDYHSTNYEPALGNPDVDDKVLSSKTDGTRSWVEAGSGSGISASKVIAYTMLLG